MSYENIIQDVSVRHTDVINKACAGLFYCLNLNHFWYSKIDNEGNYSFLGSHVEWCKLFAAEKLYQKYSYIRHPQYQKSGVQFIKTPQDPSLLEVLNFCRSHFQMQCLFSIIIKNDEGMEEFGFAAKSANDEQISLLINELPLLHLFVKNFWEEHPFLKKTFDDCHINIGQLIGPSFYNQTTAEQPQNKSFLFQKMGSNLLTADDIKVLKLIQEGFSAGQISKLIFRSPRTVEHRIERIKEKLTCFSKAELIKKARNLEKCGLLY